MENANFYECCDLTKNVYLLVSYHPNQPTVDIGRSLNHEQRILRDCEAMSQGQKYGFDLN